MSYLSTNIPTQLGYLDTSFLTDSAPRTTGKFIPVEIFSIVSIPRRCLMFNVMSEYGAFLLGRPAYVKALTGYISGTREGVSAWVTWQGEAIRRGAEMAKELAEMADAKK